MVSHLLRGVVLDDRFAIEAAVGEGGMAVVYKALDRATERHVAVKVLHAGGTTKTAQEHFLHEAEILGSLQHPRIVRHIAHGCAPGGEAFLVMEWLEGEDLSRRLSRGPLRVEEALRLVGRVAEALRETHARGVVHRDLKPSNLFLRGGQIDDVTLLDFGVARRLLAPQAGTQPGAIVGTPEYMAPEQVRGDTRLGPEADVFSLGCVLYECLSGRPPFVGEKLITVLANILFEEAQDIRALRPAVSAELAGLLARMLAKDPSDRPRDGAALEGALAAVRPTGEDDAAPKTARSSPPRPAAIRGEIQELLNVIVASAPGAIPREDATVQIATRDLLASGQRELLEAIRGLGAHADFLLDGSLVAVFRQWNSAKDQAILAVQAALLVPERWPAAEVSVTTGRGVRPGDMPMGEALDRAVHLLRSDAAGGDEPESASGVRLDEVTAGLVAGRFAVRRLRSGAFTVRGARSALDESRPLLGRPTPCVGREPELYQLEAALSSTIDEPRAQAVLILGAPGSGKSRLRHEFLRRLAIMGRNALTLVSGGAPQSAATAYGLAGQALRALFGIKESDDPGDQRRRVWGRAEDLLPPEQASRVAPFVAELCHVELDDDISGELWAARRDPALMNEQVKRAFIDLLSAECARRPLLLLFEDLHWADAPTVRLLDAALSELSEQPLLIMALARPEVHDVFPSLWRERPLQEIRLRGLGRRACERLIREVLGPSAAPELVDRILQQSEGNALFLEELIRAAAEGKTEGAPGTVLAMLQARLGRLDAGARRVLCAASVFGRVFRRGGVPALLGGGSSAAADEWLSRLVEQEILERRPEARLSDDVEYGFHHDLVRDAAYGLLSEKDRALGHYLAACYLEGEGERDAMVLAEHYARGGAPEHASKWYHRAAEQALAVGELDAAKERAQRALDAGAEGITRGKLYGLKAAAASCQHDHEGARRLAEEALSILPGGTADWYECAAHLLVSAGRLGDWDAVASRLTDVLSATPAPSGLAALTLCLSRTGFMFLMQGRPNEMKRVADEIAARAVDLPASEPLALAQLNHFRSGYAVSTGDVERGIRFLEAAIASFERAGDQRSALLERSSLVCMYVETGLLEEAAWLSRSTVSACERSRAAQAHTLALIMLGYTLSFFPDCFEEARQMLSDGIRRSAAAQNRRYQGWARSALARLHFAEGRFAEAEASARLAVELTQETPTFQAWPLGWLARALVRLERPSEGLSVAERALATMKHLGGFTMDVTVPVLACIEALRALGAHERARDVTARAKRRLLQRAERLVDPAIRSKFLSHPSCAEALALPDG